MDYEKGMTKDSMARVPNYGMRFDYVASLAHALFLARGLTAREAFTIAASFLDEGVALGLITPDDRAMSDIAEWGGAFAALQRNVEYPSDNDERVAALKAIVDAKR